jgi:hypothetical protein
MVKSFSFVLREQDIGETLLEIAANASSDVSDENDVNDSRSSLQSTIERPQRNWQSYAFALIGGAAGLTAAAWGTKQVSERVWVQSFSGHFRCPCQTTQIVLTLSDAAFAFLRFASRESKPVHHVPVCLLPAQGHVAELELQKSFPSGTEQLFLTRSLVTLMSPELGCPDRMNGLG